MAFNKASVLSSQYIDLRSKFWISVDATRKDASFCVSAMNFMSPDVYLAYLKDLMSAPVFEEIIIENNDIFIAKMITTARIFC